VPGNKSFFQLNDEDYLVPSVLRLLFFFFDWGVAALRLVNYITLCRYSADEWLCGGLEDGELLTYFHASFVLRRSLGCGQLTMCKSVFRKFLELPRSFHSTGVDRFSSMATGSIF